MEVHAHSHTARKKWTHYFWEFLMLFLAVFCGFWAENIREHKIEHLRVKEFAKSLVQDLQNDTTAINAHIKTGEIFISTTDSLFSLSKTRLDGYNAAKFSFYTRFMYWTAPQSWNRATFEQIKNSGGLRYFKNHQLLQKLMKYDALINETEGESDNRMIRGNMMLNQINQIIDPEFHYDLSAYRIRMLDTMSKETMENYFSRKIESLETKRTVIKEMLNMSIVQQRNIVFNNDTRLHPAKKLAKELIGDLKKEYHLE
jgi:hypothetical protein